MIHQTGGLRKVRWAVQGKGKSGGVRDLFLCHGAGADSPDRNLQEGIKDDLSAAEKKILKKLNENW